MAEINTTDIAQQWYDIAIGRQPLPNDTFFQFIAAWIAFNALYTDHYTRREEHDRAEQEKIEYYARLPAIAQRHRALYVGDAMYRKAIHELAVPGVGYVDRDGRDATWRIYEEQNASQVLTAVYKVRCNLFHGGKLPSNARNSALVSAGYYVISKLIAPILSKEEERHVPSPRDGGQSPDNLNILSSRG